MPGFYWGGLLYLVSGCDTADVNEATCIARYNPSNGRMVALGKDYSVMYYDFSTPYARRNVCRSACMACSDERCENG